MKKIKIIFVLANILLASIHPILESSPVSINFPHQHLCLVGDLHDTLDDNQAHAYMPQIDAFIENENNKQYKTKILLELNPNAELAETFLDSIAKKANTEQGQNVSIEQIDCRQEFMGPFAGMKHLFFLINENQAQDDNKLREECAEYGDGSVKEGLGRLDEFLGSVSTFSQENLTPESPEWALFGMLAENFAETSEQLKASFSLVENKEETTIVEAILTKMAIDNSTNDFSTQLNLVETIETKMFDLCALMNIIKNLQQESRVILISGEQHAKNIFFYLSMIEGQLNESVNYPKISLTRLTPDYFMRALGHFANLGNK